jgi:hypothetical protein
MSISDIQKEKFLNVLYKNLYAAGNRPTETEILQFFSEYFSAHEPGQPLAINAQIFRQMGFSNVEIFNQRMLHTLFNTETLYDSIFENSNAMLAATTALNKRLETLKAKRIALEAKVDDLIFSNQNSEGYFSSYSDRFSNLDGTDLKYTTAFVDTTIGRVSLPTLNSSVFDLLSTNSVISSNPTYSLSFNKSQIDLNKSFSDESFFSSVFDGLENTEWNKTFSFDSIGVVSFSINLPIAKNVTLSKIEGRLNTISPTEIYVKINYADASIQPEILSKKSTKDYDRFSFTFNPGNIGSIDLFMVKTQPDLIEENKLNKYSYRYGIRDISISGQYYDRSAVFVSKALSLKQSDNSALVIDAVSIDASESSIQNGSVSYFVCQDNESADSLSDFFWQPISKNYDPTNSYPTVVNFNGSSLKSKKILSTTTGVDNEIQKIPLLSKKDSKNLNEQNPTVDLYPDQSIYRIGKINISDNPISSYILEGVNLVNGNYVNYAGSLYDEKNGLSTWGNILSSKTNTRQLYKLPTYEITNNSLFFTGPNLSGISLLLEAKIFCANDITVRHLFVKNDSTSKQWGVGIYLNNEVSIIPAGVSSETVQWNFKAGINTLKVAIDIAGSANGSISLMDAKSLLDYGLVYTQYYGYVDPLEFKSNRSVYDNVFTIENFFGNKEIFSRSNIRDKSRIFYYTNNPDSVKKIRFRADFSRGKNPLSTPAIDSFKVKFKNSQQFSDLSNQLSADNSSTSNL